MKKIIGLLFVLLLVFSQETFAENWFKMESSRNTTVYGDFDYIKQGYSDDGSVIAIVRAKFVSEKTGGTIISVFEFKTKPVSSDSQGIFYRPKPSAVRMVEGYLYDENGKEQGRKIDYDAPWGIMSDDERIPFDFWYIAMAFSMGGAKDTVKMTEKP